MSCFVICSILRSILFQSFFNTSDSSFFMLLQTLLQDVTSSFRLFLVVEVIIKRRNRQNSRSGRARLNALHPELNFLIDIPLKRSIRSSTFLFEYKIVVVFFVRRIVAETESSPILTASFLSMSRLIGRAHVPNHNIECMRRKEKLVRRVVNMLTSKVPYTELDINVLGYCFVFNVDSCVYMRSVLIVVGVPLVDVNSNRAVVTLGNHSVSAFNQAFDHGCLSSHCHSNKNNLECVVHNSIFWLCERNFL
mmetsp:Transcript_13494/g.22348  ORF Transcript_13494/g.22348 Transcript_13494/m.22348 type:complete len:250 (+) Transcript_13494:2713-3462(+)